MTSPSSRRLRDNREPIAPAGPFGARDFAALGGILGFAILLMLHAGSYRGAEFMPWPDGLEYAAMTVNLARGLGPALHFGGYTYPSRYTPGYPLLLAPLVPRIVALAHAYCLTIVFGLLAIATLYALTRRMFDRACAIVAALLMAASPVFVTYSTMVLSDVPAMLLAIVAAAIFFAIAVEEKTPHRRPRARLALWAAFGLAAGCSILIRPTDAALVAGAALAIILVPPAGESPADLATPLAAFAAAFVLPVLWLMRVNSEYLGGAFRSGYAWWVKEVYGAGGIGFSPAYLFGATMPGNPHGNVPVYLTSLLGVDGILGNRGDARYFLYPFPAAIFAIIGLVAIIRTPGFRAARRVVWLGLGFLGALFTVYIFHVFTDVVFLLPGAFVMFIAAGYGTALANRWMRAAYAAPRRTSRQTGGLLGVVILDAILLIAIGTEAVARLSAPPRASAIVAALEQVNAKLPPDATVVSNISLEFLQLYIPGTGRNFIGLSSRDPGERFTDYNLSRLFVKRSQGWTGPIPPTIFINDAISPAAEKQLETASRTSAGAYLLLCAPESRDYATTLRDEVSKLGRRFSMSTLNQGHSIALFQLSS